MADFETKTGNAKVVVHGTVNEENLKEATKDFLKKVMQEQRKKDK